METPLPPRALTLSCRLNASAAHFVTCFCPPPPALFAFSPCAPARTDDSTIKSPRITKTNQSVRCRDMESGTRCRCKGEGRAVERMVKRIKGSPKERQQVRLTLGG